MIDIAAITANGAFMAFAEPITLDGASVQAIVHDHVDVMGSYGEVLDRRPAIDLLTSESHSIVAGKPVIVRGKTYKVDQPAGNFADPAITRVLLR